MSPPGLARRSAGTERSPAAPERDRFGEPPALLRALIGVQVGVVLLQEPPPRPQELRAGGIERQGQDAQELRRLARQRLLRARRARLRAPASSRLRLGPPVGDV